MKSILLIITNYISTIGIVTNFKISLVLIKRFSFFIIFITSIHSQLSIPKFDYRDTEIKIGINQSRVYGLNNFHQNNLIIKSGNKSQIGYQWNTNYYIIGLTYIQNRFTTKYDDLENSTENLSQFNLGFISIDLIDKIGGNSKKSSQLLIGLRGSLLMNQEIKTLNCNLDDCDLNIAWFSIKNDFDYGLLLGYYKPIINQFSIQLLQFIGLGEIINKDLEINTMSTEINILFSL